MWVHIYREKENWRIHLIARQHKDTNKLFVSSSNRIIKENTKLKVLSDEINQKRKFEQHSCKKDFDDYKTKTKEVLAQNAELEVKK